MAIDTNYTMGGFPAGKQALNVKNIITNEPFALHLEKQMASGGNSAVDREAGPDDPFTADMAIIKEKGLVAYIMELHARRLREEVLESMGLTEEDLGKMTPEQRAAVEKTIAEEIQKRMAAESILQKGDDRMAVMYNLPEMAAGMDWVFLPKTKGGENAALQAAVQKDETK
ncbi:MAG: hypothetical protein CVU71_08935 [Deltaproteobacteria bacterium HGW-Deltaproteobacteria-6]|jgi:hypothetical protein|nr:MAG: hypothetical protein CVU71_08935 [Deltaproteobacteria bacterium HGW-Deltaproteobacteria-6]